MSFDYSRWFKLPPFLRGAASVFDLFGVLPSEADRILARSDAEALASDWRAVGMDLYHAMKNFDPDSDWQTPREAEGQPAG